MGHRFSPEGLSEQHAEALERALWTAVRKLKERTMLHKKLIERQRNKGEERLKKWLGELCHHGRARSEAGARSSGADLTTAADEA